MESMRLAFDVTSVVKPRRGGIAAYGWELIRAIARVAPEHELVLGVRPNRWTQRALLDELRAQLPREAAVRLLLDPWADARLQRPDVLHAIGVRLPPRMHAARLVTLHDVNVFEAPELSDPDWLGKRQARIKQTLARAELVISYSEQGRQALAEHLGFPAERVRVVPCGVDAAAFARPDEPTLRDALERHGLLAGDRPAPYVLLVGEFSPRKNQAGLIAAFARARRERALPEDWLLVLGGPRNEEAEELRRLCRAAGLPDERVRVPGWIPDADLPALLAGAAIYACVSLHEGFGLPVLEAQAAGAPVLCSDRGALKETLGGCGVLFDPADEAGFASALAGLARDTALRAELLARGPVRVAAEFSWERVARLTLAAYEEASRDVRRTRARVSS
jgi:glycosyltransferase involved in cell wall biosynthesis